METINIERAGRTFDGLTRYADAERMHIEIMDEQPVFSERLEEDIDHYVCVLMGEYLPGAAGTRNDMEEGEQFERREVWVSQPVDECGPMGTPHEALFIRLDPDHQSWHELADRAQGLALEMMA